MEKEIKETKTRKKTVKKVENKEEKKVVKKSTSTAAKKTTTPKKAVTKKSESKTTTKTEKKVAPKKETIKKNPAKSTKPVTKKAPVKKEKINTNTREIDLSELREIIKEEKANAVRIPDVRGMSVEAAKDTLLSKDIAYEDETEKEYSLRIKAGRVTGTKPEAGKEYDKTKKVVIYESKNKFFIFFIILLLTIVAILGLTYGNDIFDTLNEQILHIGNKPAIDVDLNGFTDEKGSPIWTNNNVLKINKTNSKVKKYKYCIRKGTEKGYCEWEESNIPNIVVSESGHLYITIIPVDENGNEGKGKTIEVYIDSDSPRVDDLQAVKVTKDSIQVLTTASDRDSGIAGYYYSLNGKDFIKDNETHLFKNLKPDTLYTIYVNIVDNAGNETLVSIKARTLKDIVDENKEEEQPIYEIVSSDDDYITLNLYYPIGSTNHEWTIDMENNNWKEYTGPIKIKISDLEKLHIRYDLDGKTYVSDKNGNIVELINESVKGPDDRKDGIAEEVIEWDMPKISLEEVPSAIKYGDSYELPSSYDFGNDTGEVICLAEGNVYNNTKKLKPGKHTIECTAISSHEKYVTITKEVKVEVQPGEEEVWDGFIKLNLYYPEGSYNWQWRLDGVNGIRTGYNGDDWQDYTGPILVKLEDVENIYIRYDMDGKTYIIAPKGRLAIDIEPEKWTLNTGETTKVKIYYQEGAENRKFRLNGGDWQDYEGEFNVIANTLIEAKCDKEEKVYDSNGDYQYSKTITGMDNAYVSLYVPNGQSAPSGPGGLPIVTRGGSGGGSSDEPSITTPGPGVKAPQSLKGPNIISAPSQEIAQGVTVVITTEEEADQIYYREKSGAYKKYTGPFEVFENERISAYYIRKSDGVKSLTTYYYVDNIYEDGLPYVKISANPNNYLTDVVDSVEVTISGQDYDTLEYSLDGTLYLPYTNTLTITESTTVYAKGKNSLGETIETLDIKTPKVAVKPADDISITISTNPSSKDITGLVNKTTVTISYDSKAVKKYYSINGGAWKEYTGPFELTENATIDAYATGDNARGETSLSVNFLTTGISAPVIKPNTTSKAYQVLITIDYARTANVKQYKLGTGVWQKYTGPFYVTENTIVYAKNEDELGNIAQSSKIISNVMTGPEYTILDKGAYYLLKLNYPDVSDPSAREYKWKENGIWKVYDNAIVLVKPEYKDDVLEDGKSQVQVEDYSGNEILVDKEHVYIIDCPLDEVYENIFMRWENEKPQAPLIVINPTDPTKEVDVSITYADSIIDRLYKVVYEDGTDTGWLNYNGTFKVNKKNAIVYAKGKNRLEVESKIANTKITNIDNEAPSIEVKGDLENPKYNVLLTVSAKDNIMMSEVKYTKGSHNVNYFKENGINIANNSTITIEENGIYTIYAIDQAGNETVEEIEVTNVDKTEPNITINVLTKGVKSQVEVSIDYGDSTTKQYSFDGVNYTNYPASGNLMLSAYDLFDKKNPDGSLTLYAKGTKSTGVSNVVTEKIYNLDLEKIAAPVINANAGYPVLTEYGVKLDDKIIVVYDQTRDDLVNEISLDGGTTWSIYTGTERASSGTIKARSTNPQTGLTVQSSKSLAMPSDALPPEAYDENPSTSYYISGTTKRINISEEMQGKQYLFTGSSGAYSGSPVIRYYNNTGQVIYTQSFTGWGGWTGTNARFNIPDGTAYMVFAPNTASSGRFTVNEIWVYNIPIINNEKIYPLLTEYGVEQGYNNVTINYLGTAVQKLYKIDDGDWKAYRGKIRLELGQTIYAKGIDKYGVETQISNYKAVAQDDALPPEAYDENPSTSYNISGTTKRFNVSEEMQGRKYLFTGSSSAYSGSPVVRYYNNAGEIVRTQSFTGWGGWTGTNEKFDIPVGTAYIVFAPNAASSGKFTVNEIWPYTIPILNIEKVYPTITTFGVTPGYSKVDINYFNTSVQRLYKIDDGEWTEYTGQILLKLDQTIYAKGIDKNGVNTPEISYKSVLPTDALTGNAYDGSESTSMVPPRGGLNLYIDESMVGKRISVSMTVGWYSPINFTFYNANGDKISSSNYKPTSNVTYYMYNPLLTIPNGAVRVVIASGEGSPPLREIGPYNSPAISVENVYPILKEYGTDKGYNSVSITYFETSVQKLYKINDGEWIEYQDKPIRVELNDTIYVKGIDKDGIETPISSYKSTLVRPLSELTFDENESTSVVPPRDGFTLWIDNSMIGKKLSVSMTVGWYSPINFTFYNANGDKISSNNYKPTSNVTYYMSNALLTIPNGAVRVVIASGEGSPPLREIGPYERKIVTSKYTYPNLTASGFEDGYYTSSLHKKNDSQNALYSIDNGETWIDYAIPFIVNNGDTVLAKEILNNGNDSSIETYNFTAKEDEISTNTSVIAASTSKQFTLDSSLVGSKLRLYTNNEPASDANVKIYDKNNNLVDTYNFNGKVAVIDITNDSYKVVISSGSSDLEIADINLRTDNININTNVPIISTNTSDWSLTKIVNIIYPSGYTNEYSLDRGATWVAYEDVITIDEPITILARSVDNEGKVVTSSSYRITKIDTTEPTVSIDIDDTIVLGDSNSLPTSFVVDNTKSGGSASCKVGDDPITNTSSLTAGEHTIKCTVTTGVGKTGTDEKTIKVLDKYEITFDYQAEGINNTDKLVVEGTSLGTLPSATRTNYVFDGWYTSTDYDTEVTKDTIPIGPTTYYAKWKAEYTITFDYQVDGINNVSRKVVEGNSIGTLPTTSRTGYDFVGWYTSTDYDTLVTANTVPNGSTTYYAKWLLTTKPLGEMILEDNDIKTMKSNDIRTSSNNTNNQPGLYSAGVSGGYGGQYESGTTYFFRGNVQNNKVKFANLDWRVVRINENGTVRLILDGSIDTNIYPYKPGDEAFYELAYYRQSQVKTDLESWFNTNIKGTNANKVASGMYYCESAKVKINQDYAVNGASMSYYSNYIASFMCSTDSNGASSHSGKVGLITYDEVVFAGGYPEIANSNYYLKQDYNWYTMTPAGNTEDNEQIYIWSVSSNGSLSSTLTTTGTRLRPVINLKSDTLVKKDENGVYVVQ